MNGGDGIGTGQGAGVEICGYAGAVGGHVGAQIGDGFHFQPENRAIAAKCHAASRVVVPAMRVHHQVRSEEHTSELQSLMRISYAVFCLKKKKKHNHSKSTY